MKRELEKLLRQFSTNLSQHEYNQYIPKLRDFLIPYILNEKSYVTSIDTLFTHEFTRNDLIKSTEYYILNNKSVRSKSAIDDFLIALNRFYGELLRQVYPNQNLTSIRPFTKLSKEVDQNLIDIGQQLKEREAYPAISDDQFLHLCNFINTINKDSITSLQAKIILNFLLLFGFKFTRIIGFIVSDFDQETRTLNINCDRCHDGKIKLELPYSLYSDIKKYLEIRTILASEHNNFFLTKTGSPISNAFLIDYLNNARDSYFSEIELESLVKNPFTPTGLAKFAIINMILQGVGQRAIMDITGVEYAIYRDCQEKVDDLFSEDYNRHINYKLRAIKNYDIL